jgi:hypothetical protein
VSVAYSPVEPVFRVQRSTSSAVLQLAGCLSSRRAGNVHYVLPGTRDSLELGALVLLESL